MCVLGHLRQGSNLVSVRERGVLWLRHAAASHAGVRERPDANHEKYNSFFNHTHLCHIELHKHYNLPEPLNSLYCKKLYTTGIPEVVAYCVIVSLTAFEIRVICVHLKPEASQALTQQLFACSLLWLRGAVENIGPM